jgi:small-conductance mechanosensitive channel
VRRIALALAAALLAALPGGADAAAPGAGGAGDVRLRDARVVTLEASQGGAAPGERARRATDALAAAFAAGDRKVSVRPDGKDALVLVGERAILRVGPADAAATGAQDAAAQAGAVAAQVEQALRDEDRRLAAQAAVFALSMLVFSALVAFLLARRVSALARSWADRIEAGEATVPALSAGGVELASAGFLRAAVPLALRLGRVVAWFAALYAWLLYAATLSERTRPLGERLGQAVLDPSAAALGALARGIPVLAGLAVGVLVVGLVVRGTRRWFDAIARGEASAGWVSREHARPTGALVQGAIVVLALLAVPGLLGVREGGVGGIGLAALAALALGASPLAASVLLGVIAVYWGTLRPGDRAEVGGRRGRVVEVTFREVVLEDADGALVRVSHLLALFHPTRVEPRR